MTDAVRRVALCAASALAPGSAIKFEMPDYPPLAVFNVEGELFGEDIVCPFHSGTFCVRTGEATGYPALTPVRVYRTVVVDDVVFAEVPVVPG